MRGLGRYNISMPLQLFTIGHSTHTLEHFLELLARHGIESLADIRRFPGSRKHPHFNREEMSVRLAEASIEYHWLEALGGRRKKQTKEPSINLGLRNDSFRNYADYMQSAEFQTGIDQLLTIARQKPTAYMCSEGLFWRCHRRLVSDYLLANGFAVEHIMPGGELQTHTLTSGAIAKHGQATYPATDSNPTRMLFE